MGIEDRDWDREDSGRRSRTRETSVWRILLGVFVGIAIVAALTRPSFDRERGANGLRIELFPGSPGITIGKQSLYEKDDAWAEWLADESTCPGGEDVSLPPGLQVTVMLCLLNFARVHEGLGPVALSAFLTQTASSKARDIALCRQFSHEACGKQPFQAADDLGLRRPARREPVHRRGAAHGAAARRGRLAELAGPPGEPLPARLANGGHLHCFRERRSTTSRTASSG